MASTDRTQITTSPSSKTVNAGDDVTFHCEATTDSSELMNLEITWLQDGVEIDLVREGRYDMDVVTK